MVTQNKSRQNLPDVAAHFHIATPVGWQLRCRAARSARGGQTWQRLASQNKKGTRFWQGESETIYAILFDFCCDRAAYALVQSWKCWERLSGKTFVHQKWVRVGRFVQTAAELGWSWKESMWSKKILFIICSSWKSFSSALIIDDHRWSSMIIVIIVETHWSSMIIDPLTTCTSNNNFQFLFRLILWIFNLHFLRHRCIIDASSMRFVRKLQRWSSDW